MRPKQLFNTAVAMFRAGLPLLVVGAPGGGKTDVIAAAATHINADLIVCHPVIDDPTNYKGMPGIVGSVAEFLPFGELRRMINAKKLTIVFFDDLGQAPASVQAACMQLILARRIGEHKVSDHVVFAAATNRRQDRAGVTGILEPVKSRFASIIELALNTDDWCEWALQNDVPPELVAFVRFKPNALLEAGSATADIVNRPSPRTITNMGKLYKLGLKEIEVLAGAAGQGFATEFIGFVRIYDELPNIDAVIKDPMGNDVPANMSARYAITTTLAIRANKSNVENIIKYLKRLPEEFTVMGIRDIVRRDNTLTSSRSIIEWISKNQSILQ